MTLAFFLINIQLMISSIFFNRNRCNYLNNLYVKNCYGFKRKDEKRWKGKIIRSFFSFLHAFIIKIYYKILRLVCTAIFIERCLENFFQFFIYFNISKISRLQFDYNSLQFHMIVGVWWWYMMVEHDMYL